ncbi:MAG: hypothetical protein NZ531_05760, partial [Aquificaceae bacterium]|nr:hypothetical protein [Aquificaceae bacterium]
MEGKAVVWIHGGIRGKKKVKFLYKDKEIESILSGNVLKAYYGKGSLDLITFVPHSLYVDHMHEEREAMKKDIKEFCEFPLPSIGTISHNDTKY